AVWNFLIPHGNSTDQAFWSYALDSLAGMARNYFWFLLIGMAIYLVWVRRRGERVSLWAGLKYLLPVEIYSKPSVKIDLMMVPISWALNFVLFAGLAIGSGVVQLWLVQKFGHMPWTLSIAWLAVTLQILFTL